MKLKKWKFYSDEKDFYYHRSATSVLIKVYPIFSFCLIDGPKSVMYWSFDFNGEVAKSKKSLELMIYADMKLSDYGYDLDLPFLAISEDEELSIKKMKRN